jgi:4a-hydroxytetrahydrobiopterin dehydratase
LSRPPRLDAVVVKTWITGHPSWRLEDAHLIRELRTVDYPSGAQIVHAQVTLAEGLDHHPIITLGYRSVRFELWTHDQGGLTQLDLDYAEGLDALLAGEFAAFVV